MKRSLLAGTAVLLLAGCGSSGTSNGITVGAARTYQLAGFRPAGPVKPGVPTSVSFRIDQPSGAPLTAYKRGPGPHTGIHLIIVKDDLSTIIHQHPPVGADGTLSKAIVFPSPGRYRVVVDVYPASTPNGQTNFQLFRWITVSGTATTQPLPAFSPTVSVDGYRIALKGKPALHAIEPAFLTGTVTDPPDRAARFPPWFGALGEANFLRAGLLVSLAPDVRRPCAVRETSVTGLAMVT